MKKDNRGFTMVEIMVVVCILAIVSSILLSLISSGTVGYTRSGNSINLQEEAQNAMNQVTELLIDASNGVSYTVNNTSVDKDANFVPASGEAVEQKTVSAFNRSDTPGAATGDAFVCSEIKWEKSSRSLLYSEYKILKNAMGNYVKDSTPIEENKLFAQYVDEFAVDLSKLEKNNTVTVKMKFSIKDQEFEAEKTITVRNNILVNKGLDDTFKDTDVLKNPTVDDVILNPSVVYVDQGSSYNGFTVKVVGQNTPGQEAEWKIVNTDELTDPATSIHTDTGAVTIGANEECKVIKVKATSRVSMRLAKEDTSKYVFDEARILNRYIKPENSITVADVKPEINNQATATIHVNGVNFEGSEDYSSSIILSVYEGDKKLPDGAVKVESLVKQESPSINSISSYAAKISCSAEYINKDLTLRAEIAGKEPGECNFKFRVATLQKIELEAQEADGKWSTYSNGEERVSKRGETLTFRLVAVYAFDDGTKESIVLTRGDSLWKKITWTLGGAGIDQRVTNNLAGDGTLGISSSNTAFDYSSAYSFELTASYGEKKAKMKIVLPKVSLEIINKHEDTQCRVGLVAGDSGNKRAATIQFNIIGLSPDGNMVQLKEGTWDGVEITRMNGKNEFTIWASKEGIHSFTFYLRDAQSISNTLEISVNEANVENGGNIWPFYVPGDNINLIFFREAQKDYYDLYGNVFTYSKEGVMQYGGNTYEYNKTKKLWVKK